MKKNIGYIIMFIFGLITAGSIGVAAYNYNAASIEYSPNDKTWKVSTVAEAINSLVNDTRKSFIKYSEEETVIGEWIDGKPIYQKVFLCTNNLNLPANQWISLNAGFSGVTSEFINSIDTIINVTIKAAKGYNNPVWTLKNHPANGNLGAYSYGGTTFGKDDGVLILQYTKTTDTGSSNNS